MEAGGTAPFTYQWYQGITSLPGETAATLSLTSLSTSDAGAYTVDVTLGGTTITSSVGQLIVPAVPGATYEATIIAEGPVAYWRLGEAALSTTALDETVPAENMAIGVSTSLAQPGVSHVLAGARKVHHIRETAAAANLAISAEELARISRDLDDLGTPERSAT